MAPEGQGRIADIEVLRGVAILMVLVEHLPINLIYWHGGLMDFIWAYWHGASGVDLFFEGHESPDCGGFAELRVYGG